MKAKLIANPVAGKDDAADVLVGINDRLRPAFGDFDIVLTVAAGDAGRAAAQAVADGCEHLFVAGGDGTLNEVINGVAAVPGALSRVTFGLLPLGTGNDFARALAIPEDLDGALDIVAQGGVTEVDLGVLDDRCFVNASAGGFIAEASDAVDPGLKTVAGKLAYLIGGAGALLDHEPVRLALTVDGRRLPERDVSLFAVCNSRLLGGGRLIAPFAAVDDGLLDVCLVASMKTLELAALLTKVTSGAHVDDERVTYFRARTLDLASPAPFKVNTDGEVIEVTRCSYRVLPRAVRFFADELVFAADRERPSASLAEVAPALSR
jgi:diacylglycerol kinase (ATP)